MGKDARKVWRARANAIRKHLRPSLKETIRRKERLAEYVQGVRS